MARLKYAKMAFMNLCLKSYRVKLIYLFNYFLIISE
jgi:hypothetical protein